MRKIMVMLGDSNLWPRLKNTHMSWWKYSYKYNIKLKYISTHNYYILNCGAVALRVNKIFSITFAYYKL